MLIVELLQIAHTHVRNALFCSLTSSTKEQKPIHAAPMDLRRTRPRKRRRSEEYPAGKRGRGRRGTGGLVVG
uniref:Uncharacterized protein n=1 Tax=Arundo donax TaxID=35708 RepID=A0A0A9EP43_ARUDO